MPPLSHNAPALSAANKIKTRKFNAIEVAIIAALVAVAAGPPVAEGEEGLEAGEIVAAVRENAQFATTPMIDELGQLLTDEILTEVIHPDHGVPVEPRRYVLSDEGGQQAVAVLRARAELAAPTTATPRPPAARPAPRPPQNKPKAKGKAPAPRVEEPVS